MNRIAGRAWITVVLAGLLLVGFMFFLFEYFTKADTWVLEESSPRVYEEERVARSVIIDRDGVLLLDKTADAAYSNVAALRSATVHWVGDRQGNVDAKLLSIYDHAITGYDVVNGVYNYGDQPGVVRLTLSSDAQMEALAAMEGYNGTVAVYNYKTGEILCAVSTPNFDPDNVPEIDDTTDAYKGLYINRFTQSSFIPGSIYKIVTTAIALETIPDVAQQRFTCNKSFAYGADSITCESAHGEQDLKTAFCNSCNCYFAQLSQLIGGDTLETYVKKFGLTSSMSIDGITTGSGSFTATDTEAVNVAWSAIGQYKDLINPATFLNFVGTIANGGTDATMHMVDEITVGGNVTYSAKSEEGVRIVSEETAAVLREYMGYTVVENYGSENFPDIGVCAKTGTAEVGGDKKPNAMLAGFSTDPDHPYAFIVCVENAGYGRKVCVPIASRVLNACMEANNPFG